MKVLKKTGAIMLMALMSVMLMTGCGGSEGKDQGERLR